MLSVNQLDYLNYKNALKGNYRKGVHTFRTILANPTQAADFAANLGGVSLVLGWPIGQDDRNSQELLALLLESEVLDRATLTWMSQWYPDYSDDWDALASDPVRAAKMVGDAQFWRAVGHSPVTAGKVIATLVGLSCAEYADINAVAASQTAMDAVAASESAMDAVAASRTAIVAIAASQTAMEAVVASETAMEAVIASHIALAAVIASPIACQAVQESPTALKTFTDVSSTVMGKTVAILAGLSPDDYADMEAAAASQTAMVAMASSDTAMAVVVASESVMEAVAASRTAMAAIAASQTARAAIDASSMAINTLSSSPLVETVSGTVKAQGDVAVMYDGNAWCIYAGCSSMDAKVTYFTIDNPAVGVTIDRGQIPTISKFISKIQIATFQAYTNNKTGNAKIIKC